MYATILLRHLEARYSKKEIWYSMLRLNVVGKCFLEYIVSSTIGTEGNLGKVDYISDYEYDLFIRPDTCNPRLAPLTSTELFIILSCVKVPSVV